MHQDLLRLALIIAFSAASATVLHNAAAAPTPFQLSSTAFSSGASIPRQFTCDGTNLSPQLSWTGAPSTTQSFALIMDDPDAPAGTWVHWVLYDVPFNTHELAENIPTRQELSDGTRQGRNDFSKIGYGGPCPPPGNAHAISSSSTPSIRNDSTSASAPPKPTSSTPSRAISSPKPNSLVATTAEPARGRECRGAAAFAFKAAGLEPTSCSQPRGLP